MTKKPTYEELEQRVKKLEKVAAQHKLVEEKLRNYQLMVESAHDAIFFKDLKSRYVIANSKTLEAFGLTKEKILGKNDYQIMPNREEAKKNIEDDQFVFATGKRTEITKRMTDINGKQYWFQAIKVPQFDHKGNIVGLVGIAREITESRRKEKQLRERQETTRALLNATTDLVHLIDSTGAILAINEATAQRFGRSVDELIGRCIFNFFPPDVSGRRRAQTEKVISSGKPIRFVDEHAGIYSDNILYPVFDGNGKVEKVAIFCRDITEGKRTQKALKSQLELERVVANISTNFISMAPNEIDNKTNNALETIGVFSGVDRSYVFLFYENGTKMDNSHEWCAEGIEPQIDNLKGLSTEIVPWWMDKLNRFENIHIPCVANLPPEASAEKEILQSQDIQSLVVVPMVYGGSLLGFLGFDSVQVEKIWPEESIMLLQLVAEILANALEHKRAEEERKQLEAQFQQAKKMEAIGTLAGGIAHDFNNVLMGIQGHTTLMLLQIASDHPHFERLKGIEDMVQTGANLTKQLLGFARGGKYEVQLTDLNELIEHSSEMFGRTQKNIEINRKYQKGIWPVQVDRGQIDQVLLNLYVNAWHAMPGGGHIYIETSNVMLDENDSRSFGGRHVNYVKISVTDTGQGMDEATRQRIFDPFFTTKEMGRGTGLGLASAYGIIKNHGGIINVESEKGKRTIFNIYLPASEKGVVVKEKKLADEIFKGTETVLLVDDEAVILNVGRDILGQLGYKVLLARSGKEAVEVYRKHKDNIDLVIVDMIMPEMGGGEVYDRIKAENPEVKVLLASGYSVHGRATEILERGCDGFIQKPFSVRELSGKIRKILDEK